MSQQQELSQKIRCRYWAFISDSMEGGLKKEWIDEVLKLRESLQSSLNMNYVDLAFNELLHKNTGEARSTIFDHATRLYFRAAATCPDVVMRWGKLNRNYGEGLGIPNKIKLWFLSFFGIRSDSKLFKLFKKWHFYLSRSN